MRDPIQESMDKYTDKYQEFITKSNYYNTSLHTNRCKICNLPPQDREKVNKMIIEGMSMDIIITYLTDQYPDMFTKDYTYKILQRHKNYLPYLVGDVMFKSIFSRARHIIENKDMVNITNEERLKIITEIEEEIVKEYSGIENERISMLNVLFKETLPLIITRLNTAIVDGSYKEVKYITDASSVIMKMGTAMAAYGTQMTTELPKDEKEEIDFEEIDESDNGDMKTKVVSLADKINKAIGN